ncbi:MAG: hypothetical protein AB7G06_03210 [Bdellovibrionales bacterium]
MSDNKGEIAVLVGVNTLAEAIDRLLPYRIDIIEVGEADEGSVVIEVVQDIEGVFTLPRPREDIRTSRSLLSHVGAAALLSFSRNSFPIFMPTDIERRQSRRQQTCELRRIAKGQR